MQSASGNGVAERRPSDVVVLTLAGSLNWIVVNGLVRHLGPVTVIQETPESKWEILRRRSRLVGLVQALGQVAFWLMQRALLRKQERERQIAAQHGLDPEPNSALTVHKVPSVNSEECRDLLLRLTPRVVAVYGTRLLKASTLQAVEAPFINYHAGICPQYRGQHGGYWALASGDKKNSGLTIHLVDEGVDTGDVLYQVPVEFGPEDNISTYQYVQAAFAIPLFAQAIEDGLEGCLQPRRLALPSRRWLPPTLWSYLAIGLTRRVW